MPTNAHNDHRREDGFTLVEMLVAMTMGLLVTVAAVMFLVSIMQRQPKTTSSADVIGNARNAEESVTADLRVGKSVKLYGPAELQVDAECSQVGAPGAGECKVTYGCVPEAGGGAYQCTRSVSSQASPGGTLETVISGLASDRVFCVYPTSEEGSECGLQSAVKNPLYVGVKVELPNSEGSQANTVLEDGAALHNAEELLGG
jgi:prepilin-type N-terminal cleavage/methylation domain-containing protein